MRITDIIIALASIGSLALALPVDTREEGAVLHKRNAAVVEDIVKPDPFLKRDTSEADIVKPDPFLKRDSSDVEDIVKPDPFL
ncbi:hypothetical protein UA08_06901 [Talaromyces atroroseus]|uniref:Uncharacterized protein n=1 Tax=Talaromyces atroroseus TaxID=1441469 RepID=A0A225AQ28_TALAT|nr:hypothetical protein UA08_06901 [Talaromyces atroroseus]OKL57709.1 hypothetical protein UA08_06901 [Talaromyces atroroseus]